MTFSLPYPDGGIPIAPQVEINGNRYGAWTEATLRKSLDEFVRSWTLSFTDRWSPDGEPWTILPGSDTTFYGQGHVLDTGWVSRTTWNQSAETYTVAAEGRSVTSDLVDCAPLTDASSDQLRGLIPGDAISVLCEPFGIAVLDETLDLAPLGRFNIELGETAFDTIDRICRGRGLLPMTANDGSLVLTVSNNFSRKVKLDPTTIVTRRLNYSEDDRFSDYYVYGQHPGEERFRGARILDQSGHAKDGLVTRHRPTVVLAESPMDKANLDTQAKWERNLRMGRSETVQYRVGGLLNSAGLPWEPGDLVSVDDDQIRVHSELLIKDVEHTWDESGEWTDITLTRPEAYTTDDFQGRSSGGTW